MTDVTYMIEGPIPESYQKDILERTSKMNELLDNLKKENTDSSIGFKLLELHSLLTSVHNLSKGEGEFYDDEDEEDEE